MSKNNHNELKKLSLQRQGRLLATISALQKEVQEPLGCCHKFRSNVSLPRPWKKSYTPPLKSLRLYVASCKFRPGAPPNSPIRRVLTRSSTVQDILEYSPSKFGGDVARRTTACLALAQAEEGVLKLRTGGGRPQTSKSVMKGQTETPSDTAIR